MVRESLLRMLLYYGRCILDAATKHLLQKPASDHAAAAAAALYPPKAGPRKPVQLGGAHLVPRHCQCQPALGQGWLSPEIQCPSAPPAQSAKFIDSLKILFSFCSKQTNQGIASHSRVNT